MPPDSNTMFLGLPGICSVAAAVEVLADAGAEVRGAVFTRREVVEFILDIAGYTADQPLHHRRLLEPSVGHGDFLLPAVDRLFAAYRRDVPAGSGDPVPDLADCLRAVELHRASHATARAALKVALQGHGLSGAEAEELAGFWLLQGDFLLLPLEAGFTHVVGNPPYVRQELIPDALLAEYRRRYRTVFDRADLYVPFIERALALLAPGGLLGFICADRWMKNRYGGPLRRMVSAGYRLRCVVDMVGAPAFASDVVAYPAIVVVGREAPGPTRLAAPPAIETAALRDLARRLAAPEGDTPAGVAELPALAVGDAPWLLDASAQLAIVRRVEAAFPTLEEAGCKVGIGVATGADDVFIAPFDSLDVEPDRKLPLATTRDIASGTVQWRGLGVVNPFQPSGGLVPLAAYPRLAAYLERHGAAIRARHVSRKNPGAWYRTIDRIYPDLARRPKLLIPDIKGEAHVVYEEGRLYPHHNLYFVTSDDGGWNLRALQAVLLSDVTRAFIALYSTKMRGGYLRFQAQYLRRLRLPRWPDVPPALREALTAAGRARDPAACNAAAAALYGLTTAERAAVARTGTADAA